MISKRAFDVIFSLLALIIFALPAGLIALLIWTMYRHPLIFAQERIGRRRQPFRVLKFQTMVNGRETRLGALLRRTGLDELPQFVNVLRGDMSIVGPRALTREDIVRLGWDTPFHDPRWLTRPGITGLAQIHAGRHRLISWFWDRRYSASSGAGLDLCLLIISFTMNICGKRIIRRRLEHWTKGPRRRM